MSFAKIRLILTNYLQLGSNSHSIEAILTIFWKILGKLKPTFHVNSKRGRYGDFGFVIGGWFSIIWHQFSVDWSHFKRILARFLNILNLILTFIWQDVVTAIPDLKFGEDYLQFDSNFQLIEAFLRFFWKILGKCKPNFHVNLKRSGDDAFEYVIGG